MPEDIERRIPLGLCKQAAMKLDAFITDIHEIKEDEDLTQEDKQTFEQIAEVSGTMLAIIINMVRKEMREDEFLAENIDMDEIDGYSRERAATLD